MTPFGIKGDRNWVIIGLNKMKPIIKMSTYSSYDYSWKCIWKKCGWEATQTFNGTLHWLKKN